LPSQFGSRDQLAKITGYEILYYFVHEFEKNNENIVIKRIYNINGERLCWKSNISSYACPGTSDIQIVTNPDDIDAKIKDTILNQLKGGKPKPMKTDRFVTLPNGRVYRLYGSARNWWVLRRGEGFVRVRPVRS
jgi:hypothetical protein